MQLLADGLVQLRKGEELLVPQFGKDLPLNDLDRSFHLGFVAWGANSGRQDRHTVLRGHVLIGGVQLRLVAAGFAHTAFEVVRHHHLWDATEKNEATNVRTDPVRQPLAPGRFAVRQVTGAQCGDKDLCLADLTGLAIQDLHGLTGIVDKELLAGAVFLTHHRVDCAPPPFVLLTKPAVLAPLWMLFFVLLPEQGQGYAFMPQLPLYFDPVGLRPALLLFGAYRGKQPLLQSSLIESVRQRPGKPCSLGAQQVIRHRAPAHRHTHGHLTIAQSVAIL